jgi:hypothetical protein
MSTLQTLNLKNPSSTSNNIVLDTAGNVAIQAGTAASPSLYVSGDSNTGLFSGGADQVSIATGGTQRATIDASGRLGIGTASPTQALTVEGAGDTYAQVKRTVSGSESTVLVGAESGKTVIYSRDNTTGGRALQFSIGTIPAATIDTSGRLLVGTSSGRNIADAAQGGIQYETTNFGGISITNNRADASGANIAFGKQRSGSVGGTTIVQNGDGLGAILFGGADGTDLESQGARIEAVVDGPPGTNDMPGRLVFSTTADGASSPTQRLSIDNAGAFLIRSSVFFGPLTDNAVPLGGSGQRFTAVWAANGTIQTSDERAKADITNAALGSDFIKSLRPVSYKWIEGGKRDTGKRDEDNNYVYESVPGTRTHWGFIAQEVKQAVDDAGVDFGGWVLTDKDDPDSQQALRYDQFIAPLTKALQEAIAKIETLEADVALLKGGS